MRQTTSLTTPKHATLATAGESSFEFEDKIKVNFATQSALRNVVAVVHHVPLKLIP